MTNSRNTSLFWWVFCFWMYVVTVVMIAFIAA